MKKSKFLVLCLVLLVVALSISILVACNKGTDGNTNGKTPPNSGGKLLNGTFDGMVIKNGILTKYNGSATKLVIPSGVSEIGDEAFNSCSGLTINVRATSKPNSWSSNWNPDGRPVNWGYKG